jgi:DNA mismatch repair protein MutL
MAAIEKAYTSYIAHEAFPTCVLFLEMNPTMVDVNVHPAKLEVKFASEQPVFEAIYYTVKRAIEEHEYRPELILGGQKSERNYNGAFVPIGEDTKGKQLSFAAPAPAPAPMAKPREYTSPVDYSRPLKVASSAGDTLCRDAMTPKSSVELLERYSKAQPSMDYTPKVEEKSRQKEEILEISEAKDYKYIVEAFNCYILCEYEGAMLVIDKHAAHERVIFEDLKRITERDGRVASQALLLPITVLLSPDELACAGEFKDEISALGFEFHLGEGHANLTAIPSSIGSMEAETLFVKMVDDIIDGKGDPAVTEKIRRETALYQIACKAAIKGGRVYDRSVSEWIVKKVLELPDVIVCPHGRPIAYKLTKSELDRQFERIK